MNTCHKCNAPSHGKTCRECFLSRTRDPKPGKRAEKNARQQRYAWQSQCVDCDKPCSTGAKRCKPCRTKFAKGKSISFGKEDKVEPVAVKAKLTFSEWLEIREKALHRLFERMDSDLKKRVMVGISRNIKAQRRLANLNGERCQIDIAPIREILHDAAYQNKFYFEENEQRPEESLRRYEVYYSV